MDVGDESYAKMWELRYLLLYNRQWVDFHSLQECWKIKLFIYENDNVLCLR